MFDRFVMVVAGVKALLFVTALVVSAVATEDDCGTQVKGSGETYLLCGQIGKHQHWKIRKTKIFKILGWIFNFIVFFWDCGRAGHGRGVKKRTKPADFFKGCIGIIDSFTYHGWLYNIQSYILFIYPK